MTTQLKKPRKVQRLLMIVMFIVCVAFGYGYWHSVTHASFHIDMRLLTNQGGDAQTMPLAKVSFLDESGQLLAEGISDEKSNFVHLLHPEVGDCYEAEKAATVSSKGRTAWQECFADLSTWIPRWVNNVRTVNVTYLDRRFENIPISVYGHNSEWFLWWVPLPHVGGKPYTYYRATISVDATGQDYLE